MPLVTRPGGDALVGYSGFVGNLLQRQRAFSGLFNSRNLLELVGRQYDTLICCAAPATMWAANQNPQADRENLLAIAATLKQASVQRLVLISTIAVFDDCAAGYTESSAQYEAQKAYGSNRHMLEVELGRHFAKHHIIRLPALFGAGLKKNFIFDLANPLPSFIRSEKFRSIQSQITPAVMRYLERSYRFRPDLEMYELDRRGVAASGGQADLESAFEDMSFVARNFTNSSSQFQFYNVERLARDIDWAIEQDVAVLNICSEPLEAGEVCLELTGRQFSNDEPPIVVEDVRSDYAERFAGQTNYLYDRANVLADLKAFFIRERSS